MSVTSHLEYHLMYTNDNLTFFFFNDTATTEIYTLSLHDALPILNNRGEERSTHGHTVCQDSSELTQVRNRLDPTPMRPRELPRSEEHTSELQSPDHLVCRLLLEKKKY